VALDTIYEPQKHEAAIYRLWEENNLFAPSEKGEPFSIVLPLPNANASLHIGHTLMFAIQDVMARYYRMQGRSVLWVPGADHAGFETQVVYEKQLAKEGKSRFDFSREELFEQIWDFVAKNKEVFASQFRELGASLDWDHFTFSLDKKVVDSSYKMFKKMWDEQYIYRGERLVNYCTVHRTGFADIEVLHEDRTSPLYYLKYGPFELATTRPETIYGDTAVAVHPDDERYKKLVNTVVTIEGPSGPFEVRVVADEMVDRAFGTGVVKITPAHDFNDYEVAQRHNLPHVRVINHDGTMNHLAKEFEGLTVAKARTAVAKKLDEKGLLVKVDETYKNRVGMCYKCGSVIEPMLLDQWFIDMQKLAAPAIQALKAKKITFYPAAKADQVLAYLESIKDWNISRQIAWGIPIPAFQNVADSDDWIFNTEVTKEEIIIDGKTYRRDPDVFDTWFSSSQWPFVTLDFPDSEDFKKFYPNSVMETGQDILYQWVARMICVGTYMTGDIPFKNVYLHGMVRSEDGRKMSKSLGNVINPKEVLEAYGADAIRMGIIAGRSAGYSAAYAPGKIIAGRNFCNKLWNIARYVQSQEQAESSEVTPKSIADNWIVSRLSFAQKEIRLLIESFRFSEAYEVLYHFIWNEFADWYIEASKGSINTALLGYILDTSLELAHPFAPFVTEVIWQQRHKGTFLIAKQAEPVIAFSKEKAHAFDRLQVIVVEVRAITSALGISKVALEYSNSDLISENEALLKQLAKLGSVNQKTQKKGVSLATSSENCWLAIDDSVTKKYITKLEERIKSTHQNVTQLEGRLSNKSYVDHAPEAVVSQTRNNLHNEQKILETLEKELASFT